MFVLAVVYFSFLVDIEFLVVAEIGLEKGEEAVGKVRVSGKNLGEVFRSCFLVIVVRVNLVFF